MLKLRHIKYFKALEIVNPNLLPKITDHLKGHDLPPLWDLWVYLPCITTQHLCQHILHPRARRESWRNKRNDLHLFNMLSTVLETDKNLKLPLHLRYLITFQKTWDEKKFYPSSEGNTDAYSFSQYFKSGYYCIRSTNCPHGEKDFWSPEYQSLTWVGPQRRDTMLYHLILKFISGNDFPHRRSHGVSLIIHEKQPKVLVIW